jgi:hypothetical protein
MYVYMHDSDDVNSIISINSSNSSVMKHSNYHVINGQSIIVYGSLIIMLHGVANRNMRQSHHHCHHHHHQWTIRAHQFLHHFHMQVLMILMIIKHIPPQVLIDNQLYHTGDITLTMCHVTCHMSYGMCCLCDVFIAHSCVVFGNQ